MQKALSPPETEQHVDVQCRTAGWGCLDCKRVLFESMNRELTPIRARAAELNAQPARVTEVLDEGAEKARRVARQTMSEVRERMGLN